MPATTATTRRSDAMGADYIPERDLRASCWMKNFARRIVEHPDLYRITPAEAAEIDAVVLAFRIALSKAHPIGTRSQSLVRTKNDARKAAERLVRPAAQRFRTDPQIAADLKILIGLKPRTTRRRKIPALESSPSLLLSAAMSGAVTVSARDSQTFRSARPKSAMGMELYERIRPVETMLAAAAAAKAAAAAVKAAAAPDADPADANPAGSSSALANPSTLNTPDASSAIAEPIRFRFIGVYTRTPIRMYPPIRAHGDEVTYVARWVTRRGEPGPWGQPASIRPPLQPAVAGLSMQRDRRARAA
jgi:hypothetical protein